MKLASKMNSILFVFSVLMNYCASVNISFEADKIIFTAAPYPPMIECEKKAINNIGYLNQSKGASVNLLR